MADQKPPNAFNELLWKRRERYSRWQGRSIQQLGYTANLILTLTVASLGFAMTLVKDDRLISSRCGPCFLVVSGVFLFLSFMLGLVCSIVRLTDIRQTAKITHIKIRSSKGAELEELRKKAEFNGERTWWLLWGQLVTFGIGAVLLVAAVLFAYWTRLFPV